LALRSGLTQSAVSRIWRALALEPHRSETFKLSSDPLFIEKVRERRRSAGGRMLWPASKRTSGHTMKGQLGLGGSVPALIALPTVVPGVPCGHGRTQRRGGAVNRPEIVGDSTS